MSYSVLHTFAVNDAATQVVITDATLTASSRVGGWTGAPVDTAQTFTITPPNGAAVAVDTRWSIHSCSFLYSRCF
jgi:hypothetical protein